MFNNISCIITDDEPKMAELLADSISELYPEIEIAGQYNDWKSALTAIKTREPDIIFLDISMPGKTGFDLLELIPNSAAEIIFVTAHSEFAIEAFDFDVCGYVLKPIDERAIIKAVDRAISRINNKRKTTTGENKGSKIGIPDDSGIRYLNINDIIYLETENRYTKVVTTEGIILSSYNIGKYSETLSSDFFYQIHRSFIINVNHVKRYDATGVIVMTNDIEIPVSRKNKDEFLQLFNRIGK